MIVNFLLIKEMEDTVEDNVTQMDNLFERRVNMITAQDLPRQNIRPAPKPAVKKPSKKKKSK